MTVDYKPRPPSPKARRRGGGSCGFWFVFGAVVGGFGVGLFLMLRTPIQASPEAVAAAAAAKVEKAEAPKSVVPTRFSFHDILPELEVVVVATRHHSRSDRWHRLRRHRWRHSRCRT